jgi:hypothetical protein
MAFDMVRFVIRIRAMNRRFLLRCLKMTSLLFRSSNAVDWLSFECSGGLQRSGQVIQNHLEAVRSAWDKGFRIRDVQWYVIEGRRYGYQYNKHILQFQTSTYWHVTLDT